MQIKFSNNHGIRKSFIDYFHHHCFSMDSVFHDAVLIFSIQNTHNTQTLLDFRFSRMPTDINYIVFFGARLGENTAFKFFGSLCKWRNIILYWSLHITSRRNFG